VDNTYPLLPDTHNILDVRHPSFNGRVYIYINTCVCVCVCVCARARAGIYISTGRIMVQVQSRYSKIGQDETLISL
jgi:hypothetical protein